MTNAEQVADVIRALNGWPLMFLLAILVLRRPITGLIDRIVEMRLKVKELEVVIRLVEDARSIKLRGEPAN